MNMRKEKLKMVKYYAKSVSKEGVYFLVNGWHRNGSFWEKSISSRTLFNRRQDIKTSLTKLFKVMPEYLDDDISIHPYIITDEEAEEAKLDLFDPAE